MSFGCMSNAYVEVLPGVTGASAQSDLRFAGSSQPRVRIVPLPVGG